MSGDLDAERWRLVELLQVRAFRLFMAGPDARRLEWIEGGLRHAAWRYIPEHVRQRIAEVRRAHYEEEDGVGITTGIR